MAKALQLGRYHLLDRIAFGGMAEIYRAKTFDEEGRVHMVAVKRILSHLARDEEFIKMLVDEAKIASLMEHESIARVYEFCYAHGEYFIAMEYVDGKDGRTILDRCRAQRRWIPPEICAFIMMHIMRGLHRAHNQTDREGRSLNLIHRDVSPSNVICSYAGEVKLCDFGIAKATLSTVTTRSGVIKGKVKYMSPEQALGRKLDLRTDIFSGGSVLYELLTRVPPFLAPNEMELLVLVRETRRTPVRERNPMIPPALEAIVDTAMSRKPRNRYQTADDFANALHNFLVMHAPDLTRSHLGRFVRQLFADDIEKELRALEEYVVDSADNEKVGVNLIADALGPDADFSKFSPVPASVGDEVEQAPMDGVVEAGDGGGTSVQDPALSAAPTVILDSSDLLSRLESTDAGGGTDESQVLWKQGDGVGKPAGSKPTPTERSLPQPASIHQAHTVILELDEKLAEQLAAPTELPETEELPAMRRRAAVSAGSGVALTGKSADTVLTPLNIHELPTGEIEDRSEPSPLSDAETAELEVSDLVAISDVAADTDEVEPDLAPHFHNDTTDLLEVDDLDPDGPGLDQKPGDHGRSG